MNNENNEVLLKIFTGPHLGAEMILKDGEFTLGKSDQCSIILQDELVDDLHIKIIIKDFFVTVENLCGLPVYVNANPIVNKTDKLNLNLYDMVEIGTTHFAIGEVDGDWTKVKVNPAAAAGLIKEEKNKMDSLNAVSKDILAKVQAKTRSINKKDIKQNVSDLLINSSNKIKNNKVLTNMFISAVGMFVIMFLFTGYLIFKPVTGADVKTHKIAESLNIDGLNIKSINKKTVMLKGYIPSRSVENKFFNALRLDKIQFIDKTFSGEEIKNNADEIKDNLGLNYIVLKYDQAGVLLASGYVGNKPDWYEAKKIIQRDVKGLTKIKDMKISTIAHRKDSLEKIIKNLSLDDNVKVRAHKNGELSINGILSPSKIYEWKAAITQFKREYGDTPKIKSHVLKPSDVIDLKIKELQIGKVNFMVTADGIKYLEGAYIPGGFRVKSIRQNFIVFEKDGIEANYPIGV